MAHNDSARSFAGFLSYVRNDDNHDDGRITELRRRLSAEVQVQTGDSFPIFQDRDDILVGQRWRERIQESIDSTTLLIAIVTPSFLKSEACRDEVQMFLEREAQLGRNDLIIPVLYVPTPRLHEEGDEIATDLGHRQYFDWTGLRFSEPSSDQARMAIAELARQVVLAVERSRTEGPSQRTVVLDDDDDGLGFIELLAGAEEATPMFTATIVAFGETLNQIAEETALAGDEITRANEPGKPSSAKLAAVHRLTKRLGEPVAELERLADDYVDQLNRVGGGIDALVDRIPDLEDESEIEEARRMHARLVELAAAAHSGLDSLQGFRDSLASNYRLSSTLRPVLRRMSAAVERLLPSSDLFATWREDFGSALNALQPD